MAEQMTNLALGKLGSSIYEGIAQRRQSISAMSGSMSERLKNVVENKLLSPEQ